MTNPVSSRSCAQVPARHFSQFARRLAHIVVAVSALFAFKASVEASEVYIRLWGANPPYDPAIIAPSGTVTKNLNRDSSPAAWSWRNYSAASMGGLAVSMREDFPLTAASWFINRYRPSLPGRMISPSILLG